MLSHRAAPNPATCLRRALGGAMRTMYANPAPQQLKGTDDWMDFQRDRLDRHRLVESMRDYGSTQSRETTWKPRSALHKPSGDATLSALLASGAHFGHNTAIMNPNFMPYAYGTRSGITIIDMDHTLPLLRRAAKLTRGVALAGGSIVFVGTRPDLRHVVEKAAERVGHQGFHVGERWLPGTLTNRFQVFGEATIVENQIMPDLVIFLNPLANLSAIRECAIEHIPTIGIVDSNADPRVVMYAIPANDESTRTAELVAGVLSVAAKEGAQQRIAELEDKFQAEQEEGEEEIRAMLEDDERKQRGREGGRLTRQSREQERDAYERPGQVRQRGSGTAATPEAPLPEDSDPVEFEAEADAADETEVQVDDEFAATQTDTVLTDDVKEDSTSQQQ